MNIQSSPAEIEQVKSLISENRSFLNVFKKDWTKNVMEELNFRLNGKIPRNFLINISGLIGTPTGIFKSTMGLQMALTLDPTFTLNERVAFSINELLDKIKNYTEFYMTEDEFLNFKSKYVGTYEVSEPDKKVKNPRNETCTKLILLTKLIFFLDEQTKTLKFGGMTRLQNLVDTCRQRQICFITCGVDSYEMSFQTYSLLRVVESNDKYLPKKVVKYAVYDKERDIYYGFFRWNIIPLSNEIWGSFWQEYSKLKTTFQRVTISQKIGSMDIEGYADEVIGNESFDRCFIETKNGEKLVTSFVRALINKLFPDLTNQERENILAEIKMSH